MRRLLTSVALACLLTAVEHPACDATDRGDSKAQTFEITDRYTSTVTSSFDVNRGIGGPGQRSSDVRPALGLKLRNKTDRTLWFEVHCGPCRPTEIATKIGALAPQEQGRFTFPQDTLFADMDYPMEITLFADTGFADTVERRSAVLRFGETRVKMLEESNRSERRALEPEPDPRILPQTYEKVVLKEKFGLTNRLFGGKWIGGTLVVKPEGLEYRTRSRTVTLSAAQLRGVSVQRRLGSLITIVDYEEEGSVKRIGFETAALGADIRVPDRIKASIDALITNRDRDSTETR